MATRQHAMLPLQTDRQGRDTLCTNATLQDMECCPCKLWCPYYNSIPETGLTFDNMDSHDGMHEHRRPTT